MEHVRTAPGTSIVAHYGKFGITSAAGRVDAMGDMQEHDLATTDTASRFAAGSRVLQIVSGATRMKNARCHSGGHLLDAVRRQALCGLGGAGAFRVVWQPLCFTPHAACCMLPRPWPSLG